MIDKPFPYWVKHPIARDDGPGQPHAFLHGLVSGAAKCWRGQDRRPWPAEFVTSFPRGCIEPRPRDAACDSNRAVHVGSERPT